MLATVSSSSYRRQKRGGPVVVLRQICDFCLDSPVGRLYPLRHVIGCISAGPPPPSAFGHLASVGGVHMRRRMILVGTALVLALILTSSPARAQITTGTVSGTVKDEQ